MLALQPAALKEIVVSFYPRFLTIFPTLFAELCAGLGGGSRGRSHLQCDTEEGSDSAGSQQGSKMAGGESDASLCDRITAPLLSRTGLNLQTLSEADYTRQKRFPLSQPVAAKNANFNIHPKWNSL